MSKRLKNILTSIAVAIFWLLLWQLVAAIIGKPLLLPSPIQTLQSLFELIQTNRFYLASALSLVRIMAGYLIGVILGVMFGVFAAFSPLVDRLTTPIHRIIKATPISSIIILVLLWLSVGTVPIFTTFLIVMPIIQASVYEGIRSTDPLLIEMADFFSVNFFTRIKKIYVQTTKTRFISACIVSMGFAWKAGIAAEVLSHPKYSIGTSLYNSKIYLETEEMFAYTAVVIILSMLLEKLMVMLLENKRKVKIYDRV